MLVNKILNNNFKKVSNFQQVRHIPRWSSRTPKRVFLPENVEEVFDPNCSHERSNVLKDKEIPMSFNTNFKKLENDVKFPTLRNMKKKEETTDMLETIIDSEGNLVYSKMKDNDPRVACVFFVE